MIGRIHFSTFRSARSITHALTMMKAIRIHSYGGPEVLQLEQVSIPEPRDDELLIRVEAAGVNFVDTYQRSGMYPLSVLPGVLGKEGAGVVVKVGAKVEDYKITDRVCFAQLQGAYANYVIAKSAQVVSVPSQMESKVAAAIILQGMTAHAFTHDTYAIKKGDTVLIHAGAGGTGALLIQMAKSLGARVLTTVSTSEKAKIAAEAGADDIILYKDVDFQAEVLRLTQNRGCHVVYDAVGKDTYAKSLKCLAPLGHIIFCGNASGPVPPIDPLDLMRGGSITMTRPSLQHYISTKPIFAARAAAVFDMVLQGQVRVRIGGEYSLEQAAAAQEALTGRASIGKLLIIP